jgi:diguanylate cyclase
MHKILVIEDNDIIRANILELLEAEGFETQASNNGLEGVRLTREYLPDLILCDVMMPGLDGYSVLKTLRQDPETNTIPFIFLTALTDRSDTRKGMELGADDYLTKPFKRDELMRAIASRLQKQTTLSGRYATALQQFSQELNKLVHYDNLTNLPNRHSLQELFERTLNNTTHLPILSLGIDRFHRIVQVLGHASGDLLIQAIAIRLQCCVESCDIVARLSTDEFAIVLTHIEQRAVRNIAQNILDTLTKPFQLQDGNEVFITASIGISLYPRDGEYLGKILQSANQAMSRAQQQGGNFYEFYHSNFNVISADRLALETCLSYALERQELQVLYQPQVCLFTGKIIGAEALLRWYNPERGTISPATFIPIAEETSLIEPITEWVLKTACQQTKTWHEMGFEQIKIAVNLSGRQFLRANLLSKLSQLLTEINLEPQYLELELTERILVQNPELCVVRLSALKALGLQIAIDDFGTGYSSLSYLQQFPFDTLKIDQCFIRKLTEDSKTKAITTAIIKMAHELNLKLVAEGVETETELAFLWENNCDEMQGYLFSPSVNAEEFTNLLVIGKVLENFQVISNPVASE